MRFDNAALNLFIILLLWYYYIVKYVENGCDQNSGCTFIIMNFVMVC